ncbi:MAG: aminotransferase class I/II-fold pyridoxal phosphate-dependent enzyme [Gemmatimonadota bacterium]
MSSSSPSRAAEAERPPGLIAGSWPPPGEGSDWPALRAAGIWDVLSERGRRAVMPDGIRAWVERARGAAVDATIGVLAGTAGELAWAHGGGEGPEAGSGAATGIFFLSRLRENLPELAPAEIFPYTPVAGTGAARDAWRGWMLRKAAVVADAQRIARLTTRPLVTPGVSGALFTCGHLLLDPGDAVVVAEKRWDGYDTTFATVLGARLVSHRLFTSAGRLDLEDLERRLRECAAGADKVVAILNFPNNPTGYMPSATEVEELAARVRRLLDEAGKPFVLLFDDAYEGFVYDDAYPVSPFYAFVGLHPLCHPIKCDGVTKELLFWGGRLGALTLGVRDGSPEAAQAHLEAEWENKCSAVVRAIVSSVPTPTQALAANLLRDGLDGALAERERMIRLLRARCLRLRQLLDAPAAREAFRADPFNGGLFAFLNLRRGSAQRVALRALREHGVGVVPMESPELGINALRVTFGSVPIGQLDRLVDGLVAAARS